MNVEHTVKVANMVEIVLSNWNEMPYSAQINGFGFSSNGCNDKWELTIWKTGIQLHAF